MSNVSGVLRALVVYGCCIPLAVVVGYMLATPLDPSTLFVVGVLLFALTIPLFLRWSHPWLIASWNMSAVIFFLPGRPQLWMGVAAICLFIGIVQYTINRNIKFLHIPSVTRPLLFFTVVVLITARLTGGIGLKSMGSQTYGGKNYVAIFAAVVGYFALLSRPIPRDRAYLYVTLFFLGTASLAIGELPRILPGGLNFLYLVFPVMDAGLINSSPDTAASGYGGISRITGLGFSGVAMVSVMLARYGIRGVFFESGKPWRLVTLLACVVFAMMSGFRSTLLSVMGTFLVLFYLEGLHRTRLLPVMLIGTVLVGTLMVAFANRLPLPMQRSMAFLPVEIDPMARMSANSSSEWRLEMWADIVPQIPQYLILGKGYGFSGRDMMMISQDARRGASGLEGTELAGDYHNGPLSVIIPFGIFGVLGFVWFVAAVARVLYQNYRFGNPEFRPLNTFIFAFCLVRIVFFLFVFGSLAGDLTMFVGLVGLSVSLNGGVAKPVVAPRPNVVFNRFKLHPGVHRPVGAQ